MTEQQLQQRGEQGRMRTAREVASRVRFDDAVDEERVTVTVLDRFKGPEDKPFNSICWSKDKFIGLPQHRVLAFWYDDECVWEKESRYDAVFGSSGTTKTIREVIDSLSERVGESHEEEGREEEEEDDDAHFY